MRTRFEEMLARLRRRGADYADVRRVENRRENVKVRNGVVLSVGGGSEAGYGFRVLAGGSWGFAATDDEEGLERAADVALETARASALARRREARREPASPVVGCWSSTYLLDPFDVPLETRIALLLDATERIRTDDRISSAEGEVSLYRQEKLFASSEGSWIEQSRTEAGGGISATAVSAGQAQRRSYPNSYGGNHAAAGWEFIEAMKLADAAGRIRDEALALLDAPKAPAGTHDLVVGSAQMALQIHESVGHPTELDRILGTELSLAGGSFVTTDMLGHFRYGSDKVDLTADATFPGGCGSFGFDDEGAPARREPIVRGGILVGLLSSRETAAAIGRESAATMRAESWNHLPLIRMTNLNLEPGDVPFEDLVADTKRGILVESNRAWSIDDLRLNFQFACEIAWEIEDGRIGRMLRNPTYTGITPEFWNRCDAVADRDSWVLWAVPNCGKGDPLQVVRVAHGASPARFRGVEMK